MSDTLKRTQLYDWHVAHGDVVPFAGWEMPVRYTDIRQEHMAVRDAVGIFDTSHMSRFWIRGPQAQEFLQTLTSNNVSKIGVYGGQYTTCLNEQGGILDDLTLYRVSEEEYIWITNAVNGPKIKKHLLKNAEKFEVSIEDRSSEVSMVAIQGPSALHLLSKAAGKDLTDLARFSINPVTLSGFECYLCRTGYTGESGGEVLVLNTPIDSDGKQRAIAFWEGMLELGEEYNAKPCGLGARDSLRLEAGLVLYGNELDESTSPIEARIPYAVKFKVDPHYLGYDVVRRHKKEGGIRKTRIGVEMIDRGIPRPQYDVSFKGSKIGKITSGVMSPMLSKGIGLAYVKPKTVEVDDVVEIDIKGRTRRARVTTWPFFDPERYGEHRTL
ncbi:MAG: glycine cleavage system aminomethyltransferase GcvT [Candidatus Thorarchaeota archaeon]|nr:MAG: glycine cleavage system aminomethyltransferase GcvT [Candidatus Thorarchaeota archaeon]